MNEVSIEIRADINPTEDETKVKHSVENLFGNLKFEIKPRKHGSLLIARATGMDVLTKLHNLFRRERIRAAARGVLHEGIEGGSIVFYLNKQAAYAGHPSFSEPVAESPLGPIEVRIRCDSPRRLIDWLAPRKVHSTSSSTRI